MVADFGIARAITVVGGQRLTGAGIFVGTPAYMSPEQATGAEEVDARSDLYSLGCVLFEMLTGQAPFVGTSAQHVLARHAAEAAPSVRSLRPDVDHALDACVARALAKNPADRWATASEFGAALAAVITPVRHDAWHGRPETPASPDVPATVMAPTDPQEQWPEERPALVPIARSARDRRGGSGSSPRSVASAWSTGARTGIGAWISRAIGPDVPLDTTRVALLPFSTIPSRWSGLTTPNGLKCPGALEGRDGCRPVPDPRSGAARGTVAAAGERRSSSGRACGGRSIHPCERHSNRGDDSSSRQPV